MSEQKPSKKSSKKKEEVTPEPEEDPVLPSLEEIAEALKGESLEMVDWTPEEKQEYYRKKAHLNNSQTPTKEKLEPQQKPKTTPKKES